MTDRPLASPRVALTAACAVLALIAFAANSLLCRVALRGGLIAPAPFTAIRLLAGAAMLVLLASMQRHRPSWRSVVSARGSGWLALYALPFSFAYLHVTTGTGALLLFGSAQMSMLAMAMAHGERPRPGQWLGLVVAFAGLIGLVAPGLSAPDPLSAGLMLVAGAAWAGYSWGGRGTRFPLAHNAMNFLGALPCAIVACLLAHAHTMPERAGVLLAVASGAFASGIGYAVWYVALRGMTGMTAASVQLAVPVLAAGGGAVFLGERPTLRLAVCGALVLGGIALTLVARLRVRPANRAA